MLMVALFAPVGAIGANVTLNIELPPGAIGEIEDGENENSAFDDVRPVTLRGAVPVFEIVTDCAAEVVPIV